MIDAKKITGVALATAAAGLFAATGLSPAYAAKEEGKVHCLGVNACKGKSDCATATNACKGQNTCQGKGMLILSEKECKEKGGRVEKPKT